MTNITVIVAGLFYIHNLPHQQHRFYDV